MAFFTVINRENCAKKKRRKRKVAWITLACAFAELAGRVWGSKIFIVLYYKHKRSYLLRSRLVFHHNYQRYCLLLSFLSFLSLFYNFYYHYICKSVNRFLKRTSIVVRNINEWEINETAAQFSSFPYVKTCFSSERIINDRLSLTLCCNSIESVRSYQNKNVWT